MSTTSRTSVGKTFWTLHVWAKRYWVYNVHVQKQRQYRLVIGLEQGNACKQWGPYLPPSSVIFIKKRKNCEGQENITLCDENSTQSFGFGNSLPPPEFRKFMTKSINLRMVYISQSICHLNDEIRDNTDFTVKSENMGGIGNFPSVACYENWGYS